MAVCVRLYPSGLLVDLLNPRADQILIHDVAWALSMKCRFGGHCSRFYSVAEHSIHVAAVIWLDSSPPAVTSDWAARARRAYTLRALLHDAEEYQLGDCIGPLKAWFGMEEYRKLEAQHRAALRQAFRIPEDALDGGIDKLIHVVDQRMLATEQRALVPTALVEAEPYALGSTRAANLRDELGLPFRPTQDFGLAGADEVRRAFLDLFARCAYA